MTHSRVPWRKWAEYQKPRRGCRRGWLGSVGGDRRQILTTGQRGIGGRAVQFAITVSRAPARKGSGGRLAGASNGVLGAGAPNGVLGTALSRQAAERPNALASPWERPTTTARSVNPQKKPRRSGPAPAGGRRLARHDFPECPRDSAMTALNSAATRGDQWGIWITDEAGRTGGVV